MLEPGHVFRLSREDRGTYKDIGVSRSPVLSPKRRRELKDEALRQLWLMSLLALAIMTVLAFGLGWLVAGRMLRPIHAITSTARRLSDSTLHERIALKGPRDELKDLADTFDDMLGRLDTAFNAQKDFVANASHELRTPLTIIRTEIDVALADPSLSQEELQEMGEAVTDAVDRSEHLIDGLLVLARAEEAPCWSIWIWPRSRRTRWTSPRRGRRPGAPPRARPPARARQRRPRPAGADGRQPGGERHPPQQARRLVLREDRPRRRRWPS